MLTPLLTYILIYLHGTDPNGIGLNFPLGNNFLSWIGIYGPVFISLTKTEISQPYSKFYIWINLMLAISPRSS